MSLIRPAIRLCAIAAMREYSTYAEDRVLDSDNTPLLDALRDGEPKPYIVVYTDEDNRMELQSREVNLGRRYISLVIEMGVASAVTVDGEASSLYFPHTDQAMELLIDCLESQVLDALTGASKAEDYTDLFKQMVISFQRVPSMRSASADRGARIATRQTTLVCQPLGDTPVGVPLDPWHPVRKFVQRVNSGTDDNLIAGVRLLNAMLTQTPLPDWRQVQAWFGYTEDHVRALGIAPYHVPEDTAPPLTQVTPVQSPPGTPVDWPTDPSQPHEGGAAPLTPEP